VTRAAPIELPDLAAMNSAADLYPARFQAFDSSTRRASSVFAALSLRSAASISSHTETTSGSGTASGSNARVNRATAARI
jgi:hypothetical protein